VASLARPSVSLPSVTSASPTRTAARIDSLRRLQYLLDSAFRVPGTNFRFGWDPIIGLVPWVGDLLTAMMSCVIVFQAHQMRIPRVVQLRMVLNIVIDVVVGIVPFEIGRASCRERV